MPTAAKGNLVPQVFEIDTAIGSPGRLVRDRVADIDTFDGGAAVPAVGGVVVGLSGDEVENGYAGERRLIRTGESLVIVPGRTHREDRIPHLLFPVAVFVGEETLVHSSDRLLDTGGGVGVERQRERFGEIPGERELTVPHEILRYGNRQAEHDIRFRTHLLLIVVSRHVGEERDVVRQPLNFPVLEVPVGAVPVFIVGVTV